MVGSWRHRMNTVNVALKSASVQLGNEYAKLLLHVVNTRDGRYDRVGVGA